MPRWEPLHPAFAAELRRLAKTDVPYAEVSRRLIPVAVRLDLRRPSYWQVRRFLAEERRRLELARRQREELVEKVVAPLLTGRVPRL